MRGISKILLFFFTIFLLVIITEVCIYFFLQKYSVSIKEIVQIAPVKSKTESLINEEILNGIKMISNVSLVSSTIQNKYQGKVVYIKFSQGKFPINKAILNKVKGNYFKDGFYVYEVLVKIKQGQDLETLNFYWNKIALDKMKVSEKRDGVTKPIKLTDIKIGDSISIYETMNLIDKNCYGYECLQEYSLVKNEF